MFSLSTLHNSWNTLAQLLAALQKVLGSPPSPLPFPQPPIHTPALVLNLQAPGLYP